MRHPVLVAAAFLIAALLVSPHLGILFAWADGPSPVWVQLLETVLPRYTGATLALCAMVLVGVLLIGVPGAYVVTSFEFPGRSIFRWALILPLAMPAYVVAYAYTDFLQHPGPVQTLLRAVTGWGARDYWFPNIRSLPGAGLVFSLVLYPYVYMLARTAFIAEAVTMTSVARTLGRTRFGTFISVALPIARPAIFGGAMLALMEVLADFGTVAHFGVQTFTTGIYRAWFSLGDRLAAAQLATVLLAIVIVVLLVERHERGRRRYDASRPSAERRRAALDGWRALVAFLICAVPVTLGFLLPLAILLHLAFSAETQSMARYLAAARTSFTLAGIAAILCVAAALTLSYAERLVPGPATRLAGRITLLGYATPGAIIAVGLLIPMTSLDGALNRIMQASFGYTPGLILTGSIVALLFGYLVRFMAVALNTVDANLIKVTPSIDAAARTLGAGAGRTLLSVHVPMIRPALVTAALIVFVDVLKELPATLIMRPFNVETLATFAHRLASDERLAEAAIPSIAIVAVGLLPVILLSRAIGRQA
ncbi:MAG: iron ABC transporter permease [Hyphomicrobiaceae bacterium]|nr:iron ABC transporter permease [Hyphomicrobiaceae bacterium]